MVKSITYKGRLVRESGLAGERTADDVFAAHPNGTQLSRNTWMLLFATRGWRCADDDRSIVYQLRRGGLDGPLVREGVFARSIDDWTPLGKDRPLVRQQGHPSCFGVPRGARNGGRDLPSANLFVAKWRVGSPGILNRETGLIERDLSLHGQVGYVEWVQFRLNEAEDDVEIVQPPQPLRQVGYEAGPHYCSLPETGRFNQSFIQAVPFTPDGTEWVETNAIGSGVAPLRYRFDPGTGRYMWVQTGPHLTAPGWVLFEASICQTDRGWLVCARAHPKDGKQATAWFNFSDPFAPQAPAASFTRQPASQAPLCLFTAADGAARLFTGDPTISPYGQSRNPLYTWEINPRTFAAGEPRMVFDVAAAGLLPQETVPRAEMCKLLPHAGGSSQYLVWRVRAMNVAHVYHDLPPVTPAWKEPHGIYYATLNYDAEYPGRWDLPS